METINESLKTLTHKVLEDAYVMSLGTIDEGGVWVADVVYIQDQQFNLYWVSLPRMRHSVALEKNPKVACTITASWQTNKERALQIEGIAQKAEHVPLEIEQQLVAKRGHEVPLVAGESLKGGQVWYVLKPTKIELIHSEPFGYKKQAVEI